jgi:2-(1,2-epoxy-1,2-dihydrophenyl)acetyl-CoA isomerase
MTSHNVRFGLDGPQATITLDRPESRNSLDPTVLAEFERLVCGCRDDPDIRVLIVTGAGPVFCSGADTTATQAAATDAERLAAKATLDRIPRMIGRIVDTLLHADLITIGAINGHAVGGGWSLAAGFDHVIAVVEAEFWLPEVELGLAFRGLASVALTGRLGPALAREAMLLGRRFSASELEQFRVINAVCEQAALADAVTAVAERYLALPWKAALATRRDINAAVFGPQYY